jgi:hypothetical protein
MHALIHKPPDANPAMRVPQRNAPSASPLTQQEHEVIDLTMSDDD